MPVIDSSPTHLTTFTLKAGGQPLDASYGILGIEIRRELNRVPKASIELLDGDAAAQTFERAAEPTLAPGVEVEILGGYSSDETLLFKGILVRQRIEAGLHGGSRLTIELRDPAFRMTLGRHSRNFSDLTDSEVIEQLIGLHSGLTAAVDASSTRHPQLVQHQVSDWDFLVMRAEMAGMAVLCVDGQVQVSAPASSGEAVTSAVFGQGLLSAELELDAETQLASVEVAGWDMAGQQLLRSESEDVASASPGDISPATLAATGAAKTALRHPGTLDQATLDQWAAATMGRARRAAVRGRLRVQGNPELLPGKLVDLSGLGSRFNGTGLISGVRHRLGRGDWISELLIGCDPKPHAERYALGSLPAGGFHAPVSGLQIGVVQALEGDPAGEERIQIRLATIDETDGLLWARQALLDAGSQRSTAFRPDLDDEVVVGFLDADPHQPVILGALHSSARPSPLPGANANHQKGIVTRSGMRIHWDDDKIIATLDTPAGNRLVLSEDEQSILIEDQNGNKLEMSPDGIALESPRDIQIKATGDVKIEGVNVEIAASAQFKASGGAGAEVSASGATVIKGSVVQIN